MQSSTYSSNLNTVLLPIFPNSFTSKRKTLNDLTYEASSWIWFPLIQEKGKMLMDTSLKTWLLLNNIHIHINPKLFIQYSLET